MFLGMVHLRPLCVVVASLSAAPIVALAQTRPLGPLTAEEGAPLQRLGLTPTVEGADPLPAGALRVDLWLGYSNIFEQDSTENHSLYLDLERLLTALTVRYGPRPGLEVGGRVTLQTDWGGFLDPIVEGAHDLLGLGNRARPDYPHGSYGQTLRDGGGRTLVDIPARDLAVEDVRFFAKWLMTRSEDGRRALSAKVVVRMPTADNAVGRERGDVAVLLLGRTAWRRWHLHGLVGASTVRRSPELEDVLVSRQAFFSAGIEHPFSPRLSAAVQVTGSTQLLRSFDDHDVDGALTNVVFGLVGEASGWRWEVGMQEDAPPRGPSLDFTLQLGLGRSF